MVLSAKVRGFIGARGKRCLAISEGGAVSKKEIIMLWTKQKTNYVKCPVCGQPVTAVVTIQAHNVTPKGWLCKGSGAVLNSKYVIWGK